MSIFINHFRLSVVVIVGFILVLAESQNIPVSWQSSTNLSSSGFEFVPVNEPALLLSTTTTNSILNCVRLCHSTVQCRILDFDAQSHRCRLFQGNIRMMGSIVISSSPQSRVGSIKLSTQHFLNYGQPCSSCQGNRYLTCMNGSCQCPVQTYFDGSICQSQKLLGNDCGNSMECRTDLNYTCLPRMQCGPASFQVATIAAGNANGVAGNTLHTLNFPTGISVALDNALHVSDYFNSRVLRFPERSLNGSIVAGTGVSGGSLSQLHGPTGLHIDASLNVYVADSGNHRVMLWRKNATAGVRVAGSGSFGNTLSSFGTLSGLFVDTSGNIYVCDVSHHRVMKFMPNVTNGIIVAGTGVAGSSSYQLNVPYGIYLNEANSYLYVADYNNHRIQRYHVGVSTNGTVAAGGSGSGLGNNQLNFPYSVCVSKTTNAIYIADSGNNRVQRWNFGATFGVTIAGNGASLNNFSTPLQGTMDIRLNVNETNLYVSEAQHNRVWRFQL